MIFDTEEYMPQKNASKHAGVSEKTINDWYRASLISAINPWEKKRSVYYSIKDIDAMVSASKRIKKLRLTK